MPLQCQQQPGHRYRQDSVLLTWKWCEPLEEKEEKVSAASGGGSILPGSVQLVQVGRLALLPRERDAGGTAERVGKRGCLPCSPSRACPRGAAAGGGHPAGDGCCPTGQPRCSRSPRWRVGPRVAPAPPPRGGHAWAGRGRSGGAGAARRGARPQRAALGPARQRLPPPRHHVAAGHGAAAGRAGRGSESAELAGRVAAVGLWRWERGRRSITPRYREFVVTCPPASEGGCARGDTCTVRGEGGAAPAASRVPAAAERRLWRSRRGFGAGRRGGHRCGHPGPERRRRSGGFGGESSVLGLLPTHPLGEGERRRAGHRLDV